MPWGARNAQMGGSLLAASSALDSLSPSSLLVPSLPPCDDMPRSLSLPVDPTEHFFLPQNITYLNVGTLGPMPRCAVNCATALWSALEIDPTGSYDWDGKGPWGEGLSRMDAVRARAAAALFVGDVKELSLVQSTTVALHWVAQGLISSGYIRQGGGQRVLTTDMEHLGGVAAWEHLVKAGFLDSVDKVTLPAPAESKDEVVNIFERALRDESKNYAVVCISHVLTTTGAVLPLPRIATLAHESGAVLVIDGAQAAGSVHLNIAETGADAYTMSGHKGLLGPTGSGLLYIRETARAKIRPAVLDRGPNAYTQSSGTVPLQTLMGLGYALDFMASAGGLAAIVAHGQSLASATRRGLEELAVAVPGVVVLSPPTGSGMASSIVSVALPPGVAVQDVITRLKDGRGRLVVKTLLDHEGGTQLVANALRVSYHMYNSIDDVQRFLNLLRTAVFHEMTLINDQ